MEATVSLMLDTDIAAARAVVSIPNFPESGKTLGWTVNEWIEDYLLQPDGDHAGEPLVLTDEQLNFLLWFYSVDDSGRFKYRRAVLRRAKGWGKSPFLGAISLAQLCGPVLFDGWDANGDAVGRPDPMPWIVIAGVSEAQTENTLSAIRAMSENSAGLVDDYGLDIGKTRIFSEGGGKLQPVTASASTQEGARTTFAILDETHHWTSTNGGHALSKVIRRNLAKMGANARSIETTNAHEPGQDSVAERSYLTWLAIKEGRTIKEAEGVLYDSREADEAVELKDPVAVRAALAVVYGDSHWVDLDRILSEVYDPDTPPEEARRFYLNQIVAAADSWITPPEWNKNRKEIDALKFGDPKVANGWKKADTVTLGFDGSLTDDSTALMATRVSDGAPFLLAVWEKPEGPSGQGWEVPKEQVRDAVDNAFATLDVVAFFSDVAYWETDIDTWREKYGERLLIKATTRHSIGFDMRGNKKDVTVASEAMWRAITDGEMPWRAHNLISNTSLRGDEIMTRHFLNARRRINQYGVTFGKENRESPKKVDVVAATMLSRMARSRVLDDPKYKKRSRSTGRAMGFS